MPEKTKPGHSLGRRAKGREMTGVVLNDKTDKTVKVLVERLAKHRKYKKYIRYRAKYMAHDPHNRCRIGDTVRIIESRPMSKLKRWRVLEILD